MSEHEKSSGSLSDSDSSDSSSFGSSSVYFSSGSSGPSSGSGPSSSSSSSSSCVCDFDGYVATPYDGDVVDEAVVHIDNVGCGSIEVISMTFAIATLAIAPPLPHTIPEGMFQEFVVIGDGDIRAITVEVVTDCSTKTLPSVNTSP